MGAIEIVDEEYDRTEQNKTRETLIKTLKIPLQQSLCLDFCGMLKVKTVDRDSRLIYVECRKSADVWNN